MKETRQCSLNCGEDTADNIISRSGCPGETFSDYVQEPSRDCSRNMTRIKICGLSRPEDIAYVNEALPDYCGFIINFPKSHRNVTPDKVRSLVKGLDKRICPVGVFVDQPMETILSLAADGTLGAVQLHGSETQEYVKELKRRLAEMADKRKESVSEQEITEERKKTVSERTRAEKFPVSEMTVSGEGSVLRETADGNCSVLGETAAGNCSVLRETAAGNDSLSETAEKRIPVIQAFAIRSEEDIIRARNSAADYILLDRGTGTGQTFDWNLIKGVDRPFFLAGGLGPDNLAEAVGQMRPFAVDMSSGVETEKVKDRGKILRAVNIVAAVPRGNFRAE